MFGSGGERERERERISMAVCHVGSSFCDNYKARDGVELGNIDWY